MPGQTRTKTVYGVNRCCLFCCCLELLLLLLLLFSYLVITVVVVVVVVVVVSTLVYRCIVDLLRGPISSGISIIEVVTCVYILLRIS